jgi:hypothetical protein
MNDRAANAQQDGSDEVRRTATNVGYLAGFSACMEQVEDFAMCHRRDVDGVQLGELFEFVGTLDEVLCAKRETALSQARRELDDLRERRIRAGLRNSMQEIKK